jgi:hypothetical protein
VPGVRARYDLAAAAQSRRRAMAGRYLHRVRNKHLLSQIEIVDLRTT